MEFKNLHQRALAVAGDFRKLESEMIELLQSIEACRGFTELGYASLFTYVVQELKLSEASAYQFITVSRKALAVPQLKAAIERDELTVSKAKIIAPVISLENQEIWLGRTKTFTKRELEKAVAEERPLASKPELAKAQGNQRTRLEFTVSDETYALFERARELLAQKKSKSFTLAEAFHVLVEAYVKREDPVEKADRSARNTRPGTSASLHKVHHRDRGYCQFQQPSGKTCGQRKWIHVHHKKPRAQGGGDELENLITLCAAHHSMVHRA